jgi:putative glutamine amidotransferase
VGHVQHEQVITINGDRVKVNSYHRWGTRGTSPDLEVWAVADDGVVKAVRHKTLPILGVMWHPERIAPPRLEDKELLSSWFAAGGAK